MSFSLQEIFLRVKSRNTRMSKYNPITNSCFAAVMNYQMITIWCFLSSSKQATLIPGLTLHEFKFSKRCRNNILFHLFVLMDAAK
jgi:hypothetical protein